MCLPRFVDGWCCCSLRFGALLVAWPFTVLSIVGAGLLTLLSAYLEKFDFKGEDRGLEEVIITIYVVVAIFTMFVCIFNFLLLLGIYKKSPNLMIPWQLLIGSCLLISGLAELLNLHVFRFRYQGEFLSINYRSAIDFFVLICFLIVYSHFKELRERTDTRNLYMY